MTVLAATRWNTNADMILDVVALGYIKPTDKVIDLTFGRGKWWTKYGHDGMFIANFEDFEDARWPEVMKQNGRTPIPICKDYTVMPDTDDDNYDVVVFDPPYISMGGRATSGLPDFMDRFGLANAATTPRLLQDDNEKGLAQAVRICKPGGLILAKCAPYISSGKRQEGDWWARDAALAMGLVVQDMLIHLGDERAQPKVSTCRKCGSEPFMADDGNGGLVKIPCPRCGGSPPTERRQKHARNNYSVLWVFAKPKVRTRKGVK